MTERDYRDKFWMSEPKEVAAPVRSQWATQRNVVNHRSGRHALQIRSTHDDNLIATLPGCERDAANAALLAAAPELLEALQAVHMDAVHLAGNEFAISRATVDKVAAAIAKATGGAS